MPHQATVTGKTGPDRTVTAAVLADVQRMDFQLADKRLQVFLPNQAGDQIKEFDLSTVTTVTFTISAGNYTIVVS